MTEYAKYSKACIGSCVPKIKEFWHFKTLNIKPENRKSRSPIELTFCAMNGKTNKQVYKKVSDLYGHASPQLCV